MTANKLGLLCALGAAVLFSFKPVLVKMIYAYDINTITLLSWRMILSLPVYLLIGVMLWQRKPRTQKGQAINYRPYIHAAVIGLIGYYFAAIFDLQGLKSITAQLERLILFSYPSWVALLSWWLLKKPFTKPMWLALLISYIGIGFIFISDWQQLGQGVLIGSTWVLLAALAFSIYIVLSKPLIDLLGAMEFTIIAMVSSSVIALIHFFLAHHWQALIIPLPAFWLITVMALVATVIPSFLLAAAILRIGPANTALVSTIGPAMTALFAVILLGEHFGWAHLFGLMMVIIAVFIMQTKPRVKVCLNQRLN